MKNIIRFIIVSFVIFIPISIKANNNERIVVTLNKCVDGDTAWFNINNETLKARFLAIDTPESTTKIEEYGKEASNYTCNELKNANKIEIEYDENSDKTDKYKRILVWVFVDNELLQEKIINEGLAEVAYLYGDYKYTNNLKLAQNEAKAKNIGIWSNSSISNENYILIVIAAIIIIIIFIFNKNFRKKCLRKINNKVKKKIRNSF